MKLFNDDCVKVMESMEDECIDLTITSPPYDNLREYDGSFNWDFEVFQNIATQLLRTTKEGGVVVWVVGDETIKGNESGTSFKQALYFKDIGFNLLDTMIYEKAGTGACGSSLCYWQAFEYMFVLTKGRPKTVNRLSDRPNKKAGAIIRKGRKERDKTVREVKPFGIRNNIWQYGFSCKKVGHPAIFQEKLAKDHILSWSNEGDTVLDPMMGSGTVGKMAQELNREFVGIEIVEEYFELAKVRINV